MKGGKLRQSREDLFERHQHSDCGAFQRESCKLMYSLVYRTCTLDLDQSILHEIRQGFSIVKIHSANLNSFGSGPYAR
jgi:hypothetical protein